MPSWISNGLKQSILIMRSITNFSSSNGYICSLNYMVSTAMGYEVDIKVAKSKRNA